MSKGGQPVTNRPFLSRKQVMRHQALLAESKRLKGLIDRYNRILKRSKATTRISQSDEPAGRKEKEETNAAKQTSEAGGTFGA